MYEVYTKHRSYKRARPNGIATDNYERAVDIAKREMASWWGVNGIIEWAKIKDCETGKYIATFQN